jgi:nitrate reductase NapAB chaperone NapD
MLAIILVGFPKSAFSQQILFNKTLEGSDYKFNYQWLDHNKKTQGISFSLTKESLFERFRHLKSYKSTYAQKTILRRIKKHMKNNPIPGMQISYRQNNGQLSVQVKGQNQQQVTATYQKLKQLEIDIQAQYFTENHYQFFTNHEQLTGIKINHVDVANKSVSDLKVLKPIILEKMSIQNIRKVSNFVLGFVQSIPYNPLQSRATSSGAGFNPPTKVLWENQGDCDSKMTLIASILRGLMPRIKIALIYIDNHAFIGLAIESNSGEVAINYKGTHYILAEPTGPALLKIGQLPPESELAITQGRYSVEEYHEIVTSPVRN